MTSMNTAEFLNQKNSTAFLSGVNKKLYKSSDFALIFYKKYYIMN